MYNNLVENCFDKCVMTDWYGVSFGLVKRVLLILCRTLILSSWVKMSRSV